MMARQSMLSMPQSPDSPTGSPDKGARAPLLAFDSSGNLSAAAGSPDKQSFGVPAPHSSTSNRMSYPHPGMQHSQSAHTHLGAPVLGGNAAGSGPELGPDGRPRLTKSKSVFGVDTIWEREMAKLKIMQEAEARDKAEREEQERARMEKKGNRKSFWAGGGGKVKDKVKAGASPLESPSSAGAAMAGVGSPVGSAGGVPRPIA